ncbi:MAG: NifB/NifX family molybdenum-iron cluster-binding protein [Nitrososphaerales archaeon]|jgi:predicted Fe-Mo cluster-binding NifX family protein
MDSKKVAVVTDDNKTISPHFGRAQYYLVYEIQDGTILNKETRPKSSHHHRETMQIHRPDAIEEGGSQHPQDVVSEESLHDNMLSNVRDCEALISRGMGYGMHMAIEHLGIKPYITSIASADDAVKEYMKGTLDNHVERLH